MPPVRQRGRLPIEPTNLCQTREESRRRVSMTPSAIGQGFRSNLADEISCDLPLPSESYSLESR